MSIKTYDARDSNSANEALITTLESLAKELYLAISVAYAEDDRAELICNAVIITLGAFIGQAMPKNMTVDEIQKMILPYILIGISHTIEDEDKVNSLRKQANEYMKDLAKTVPLTPPDKSIMKIIEKTIVLAPTNPEVKH